MSPKLLDRVSGKTGREKVPLLFAHLLILLLVTWAGVFAVRLLGPPDLLDNDQARPAAYALDLLTNHHWLVQRDDTHDITSKPPLYIWIVALTAVVYGRLNDFSLYLPGALAIAGVAILILFVGRKPFGPIAAFFGAASYLLSSAGFKQVHLARTDALFSLLVMAGAVLAVMAARRRTSWVWFWVVAALSTMAKTPVGPILSAGAVLGLIGLPVKKGKAAPTALREHLAGVTVFLVIAGGWFLAAWISTGHELIVKMIGKELVGHAMESAKGQKPFEGFGKPILYFISRHLPWSVLALVGIVRVFIRPAAPSEERLLERWLTAYFLFGLFIFSASPHQRWDHLFPLLPAASLLCGRELAQLIPVPHHRTLILAWPAILVAVLGISWASLELFKSRKEHRTILSRDAARFITDSAGSQFPVMHVDTTMGVQYYLGTMRQRVPHDLARQALLSDRAAYVLLQDEDDFWELLPDGLGELYDVKDWVEKDREYPFLRLIGNRPTLAPHDKLLFYFDGLEVQTDGVRVIRLTEQGLVFEAFGTTPPAVDVRNMTLRPRSIRVSIRTAGGEASEARRLDPQEVLRLDPAS